MHSSPIRFWIPRAALCVAGGLCAALPYLLHESLYGTLDAARGNRIDPDKIPVLENGCYAVAFLLMGLAAAWPRILRALELLAARLERYHTRGQVRRRPAAGRAERLLYACYLTLLVVLPANLLLDPTHGMHLAAEDGLVETGTAILYLLAAAATVATAARFRGARTTRWSLFALAGLFFVVGMEEVSWGQRVFGVATPGAFADLNVQGELTLHNLWSTSINQALALGVTFILLAGLPLAHRFWPVGRRLIEASGLPVASASIVALYSATFVAVAVIGLELGTLGIGPRSLYGHEPHFDDEYLEFFLSGLFCICATSGWRLEARPRANDVGRATKDDEGQDRLGLSAA